MYPFTSVSSVAQLCPSLYDPMNRSTPGLAVPHQLPKSTQTHVHRVGDAIQPSHPLLPPSPPALHLSQCQGLLGMFRAITKNLLLFSCLVLSDSWRPHGLYQAPLSFAISWSLLRSVSVEFMMLSNHLILLYRNFEV